MSSTHEKDVLPSIYDASSAPQMIERVFTDLHGRQFRLVFLVSAVNGELKGRLVSAHPLPTRARIAGNSNIETSPVWFLPIVCAENKTETVYVPSSAAIVSPYVSLEFLMTSQPTRAPSK
jgi:hypothetical protein